jgi:hypothetical protein
MASHGHVDPFSGNGASIDIAGCQNVTVSDCVIDTGDDAICIKSEGVDGDACQITKNMVVTNCIISSCCNGFKIGTKTENGFENTTFSNSVLFNEDVPPISLTDIDRGWISGAVAPEGSSALLTVHGAKTKNALISGCDLREAEKTFAVTGTAISGAVRAELNIEKRS